MSDDKMVRCRDALTELQSFLDGELDRDRVDELASHLTACAPCGDRAEFERHVRVLIRTRLDEQLTPPPGLEDRIRSCLGDTPTTEA